MQADRQQHLIQVLRQRVAERRAALAAQLETVRIFRQGLLVQSQATTESALAQYRVGKVTFASVLDANAGWLSDRSGRRKSLALLGYGFSTLAKTILLVTSSVTALSLFRVIERLGKS